MSNEVQNSISPKELFRQYDWFQKTFPDLVQNSWDEFFEHIFDLKLMGISKNINCLLTTESCFVTKINLDKEYEIFFRLTDSAVDALLTATLGKGKGRFKINTVTELETKIITTFNSYIFGRLKETLNQPNPSELRRTNFDVIHLTFFMKTLNEEMQKSGKFIITIPQALISPVEISSTGDKFGSEDFPNTETVVKVYVGKTKFKLYDIKNLEEEDIVVFDDSNINNLKVITMSEEVLDCSISPNMDILMTEEANVDNEIGEQDMANANNLWDSIEVEMYAEFDAVKISLGELKSIENGLVVDLASLYDNTVTLKVEGRPIAKGDLVIVNDRYGVKISEVVSNNKNSAVVQEGNAEGEYAEDNQESENSSSGEEEYQQEGQAQEGEEEFDYSDFELEDEGI